MPVHRLAFAIALTAVLAVPAGARAGGWATTGLSDLPRSPAPGDIWRPTITIKAHGMTPLDGLKPSVRIIAADGAVRVYPARPAGGAGRYVAAVAFPAAGRWRIRIFDGYTDAIPHELGTFTVTGRGGPARPSAAPDGGAPW